MPYNLSPGMEWQTLPLRIDPIAFTVGFFSFYWYAFFLLLGISLSYLFLVWLYRRGKFHDLPHYGDIFFFALVGGFLGGKLGYILFYAAGEFLAHPGSFLFPYDFSLGLWVGLPGMSYHGAILGTLTAVFFLSRKNSFSFWRAADLLALVAPIVTFFGRLGNFFTGELPGRLTTVPWAMYFPGHSELRHPSTLYEALGEGLLLFWVLWGVRKRFSNPGDLMLFYLSAYSVTRFFLEFFREPDANRGLFFGQLTQGQIFSLLFFAFALLLLWKRKKERAIIPHVIS